ncbi:MAG: hypothetical protein ACOCQC_00145 [Halanaerobiaceae bacterium]
MKSGSLQTTDGNNYPKPAEAARPGKLIIKILEPQLLLKSANVYPFNHPVYKILPASLHSLHQKEYMPLSDSIYNITQLSKIQKPKFSKINVI